MIGETYRRMDMDIRREDDDRWSDRNMEDTVFENVYYLAIHVIEAVVNEEVMELFGVIGGKAIGEGGSGVGVGLREE